MARERGFTLLEVVVTTAVLAVVVVMFGSFMTGFASSVADRRKATITTRSGRRALENMAESLRSAAVNFTGDGTATLAYQVPVDPDGGGVLLYSGDEFVESVRWGVRRSGQDNVGETTMFRFAATDTLSEADRGFDLNGDGDTEDVFDVGHVEQAFFATIAAVTPVRPPVVFSPDFVLQEQGAEFGDIDGDGNPDPMFSWEGVAALRITLFVTDLDPREPSFERLSTVVELRNKTL